MLAHGFKISFAVRTGLEPATPGVTGRYSNQTELPHQKRCKINPIFHSSKFFTQIYFTTADTRLIHKTGRLIMAD